MVACSKKSYLGPVDIASFVFLVSFKDCGRRVSPRFHLFVSDVNQGMRKRVEFKISFYDLPGAVKNRECALEVTWACFGQRKAPL